MPLGNTLINSSASKPIYQPTTQALDSQHLATALRDALANSGLFYESHQAQWIRGERSTSQLLVEPQNQLPTSATPDQAAPARTIPHLPIAQELVTLVQQQLHTLETHQLSWNGQVWPGQPMRWEIEGQPERHSTQQNTDTRQWSTELELALPKLGDVHIRLEFNQLGVKLNLHASNASAVSLLTQQLPQLANTLAHAGVALTQSVIEKS